MSICKEYKKKKSYFSVKTKTDVKHHWNFKVCTYKYSQFNLYGNLLKLWCEQAVPREHNLLQSINKDEMREDAVEGPPTRLSRVRWLTPYFKTASAKKERSVIVIVHSLLRGTKDPICHQILHIGKCATCLVSRPGIFLGNFLFWLAPLIIILYW